MSNSERDLAVIVSLQVEGIHKWDGCNIEGMDFLKHLHRHIFFITAKKSVIGTDREVEIIMLKRCIIDFLRTKYHINGCLMFGNMSCEDIAVELLHEFHLESCKVLEDNENGAEAY